MISLDIFVYKQKIVFKLAEKSVLKWTFDDTGHLVCIYNLNIFGDRKRKSLSTIY